MDIIWNFHYNRHWYSFVTLFWYSNIIKGGEKHEKNCLHIIVVIIKNKQQSLDGEYYWISSERNELAFTIKGDNASIEHGEADSFTINKQKNTIELTGQNIASRTEEYSFKDGVFSVDISGVKQDYYLKDSEAYNNALKQYGYK